MPPRAGCGSTVMAEMVPAGLESRGHWDEDFATHLNLPCSRTRSGPLHGRPRVRSDGQHKGRTESSGVKLLMPLGSRPRSGLPGYRVPDIICSGGAEMLTRHQFLDPPPQCFVPYLCKRNLIVVRDVHGRLRLFLRPEELVGWNAN
jgi:hypothetical protein